MENLALMHAAIAQEYPLTDEQLQALEALQINIPSSAWMGVAGLAVGLSVLGSSPDAQAAVRRGDACSAVSSVQSALVSAGYSPGAVDGVFGGGTEYAVIRYQQRRGLSVDGVVGPATASALGLSPSIACGSGGSGTGGGGAVTVSTNGGALSIRSGPGTGYGAIGSLGNGARVSITGRTSNGWYELSSGGWIAGWWTTSGGGSGTGGGNPGGGSAITVSTNGSALTIRSGPGTGYGAIGSLSNGSSASITGRVSNGWYELARGGWVSGAWVY